MLHLEYVNDNDIHSVMITISSHTYPNESIAIHQTVDRHQQWEVVATTSSSYIEWNHITIPISSIHIHNYIHLSVQRHLLHSAPAFSCLNIRRYLPCSSYYPSWYIVLIILYSVWALALSVSEDTYGTYISSYTIYNAPGGGIPNTIALLCSHGTILVNGMIHGVQGTAIPS